MQFYTIVETSIGCATLVSSPAGLSHVHLSKGNLTRAAKTVKQRFPDAQLDRDLLPELRHELDLYFAGQPVCFSVKVDLAPLTEFQRRVLRACSQIPYGRTLSYGDLARRAGCPAGARAVGAVMSRNPVPLVIPCHRVVASGGKLGGFSAEQGVSLKWYLLELESRGRAERVAM